MKPGWLERGWGIIAREFVVALATSIIVTGLLLGLYESKHNQELYENQIAACERGKVVREVLHGFLAAAIDARRTPPLFPGDVKAAKAYAKQDARIWPIKPCVELIQKP